MRFPHPKPVLHPPLSLLAMWLCTMLIYRQPVPLCSWGQPGDCMTNGVLTNMTQVVLTCRELPQGALSSSPELHIPGFWSIPRGPNSLCSSKPGGPSEHSHTAGHQQAPESNGGTTANQQGRERNMGGGSMLGPLQLNTCSLWSTS
jgi:hypothetical protein